MDRIEFTAQEEKVRGRSGDTAVVRRYRRAATGTALLFCLLFSGLAAATGSVWTVTICAMLYVLLTLAEKLAYARALLHYKSVIVKLAKRIQELNHRKD